MFYVYEWYVKETGEIIYVGKGTRNRYKVRKHNRMFDDYIRRIDCESRIVKTFDDEKAAFNYESERMSELKSQGQCVCNINKGGKGGSVSWWDDELRERYSKNNVMKSAEQRKRMSENNPMKNHDVAKKVGEKHRRKICVEDRVYDGLFAVADAYNVSQQNFLYWLERGYTNDHERCYYYGEKPKDFIIRNHSCNKERKPVIIDGVFYESTKKASIAVGGTSSALSKSLRNGKTFKGHECHYA